MAVTIVEAASEQQLAEVRALLSEYVEFIASHNPLVDRTAFAAELRDLRDVYRLILLAVAEDGRALGCVMLRDGTGAGLCEARRLYVRPEARRRGVARSLMLRLMAEARRLGCRAMQLVTVVYFTGAVPLYLSLGFREVEPFRPSTMSLDVVRFMERPLEGAGQ